MKDNVWAIYTFSVSFNFSKRSNRFFFKFQNTNIKIKNSIHDWDRTRNLLIQSHGIVAPAALYRFHFSKCLILRVKLRHSFRMVTVRVKVWDRVKTLKQTFGPEPRDYVHPPPPPITLLLQNPPACFVVVYV
jgi:hypothetical protein